MPHGIPLNCTLESPNATSLLANFTLPQLREQNGIITSYQLTINEYTQHLDSHNEIKEVNNTQLWPFHVFHGLTAFTYYNVTIAARTSVGLGPHCKLSLRTVEECKNIFFLIILHIIMIRRQSKKIFLTNFRVYN